MPAGRAGAVMMARSTWHGPRGLGGCRRSRRARGLRGVLVGRAGVTRGSWKLIGCFMHLTARSYRENHGVCLIRREMESLRNGRPVMLMCSTNNPRQE